MLSYWFQLYSHTRTKTNSKLFCSSLISLEKQHDDCGSTPLNRHSSWVEFWTNACSISSPVTQTLAWSYLLHIAAPPDIGYQQKDGSEAQNRDNRSSSHFPQSHYPMRLWTMTQMRTSSQCHHWLSVLATGCLHYMQSNMICSVQSYKWLQTSSLLFCGSPLVFSFFSA